MVLFFISVDTELIKINTRTHYLKKNNKINLKIKNKMAFFGITSLGLQNHFEHNLVNALAFKLFSEDEFAATFKKIDKDNSGYI